MEDVAMMNAKCILNKTGTKNAKNLKVSDCVIKASVTAGIVSIEIPERKNVVSIRIQDFLKVLDATNTAFQKAKEHL